MFQESSFLNSETVDWGLEKAILSIGERPGLMDFSLSVEA